jgi:GTP cyclohydrolase II
MLTRLETATIRTRVELPLRFADGYTADARVFTFDGLVDDREHLAFALGDHTALHPTDERRVPLIRPTASVALQDAGVDTYEANLALGHGEDERSYVAAAQMLHALGVSRVALLSNNPDKARQLRSCGVTVVEQVPTGVYVSAANHRYLETKARRGRHTLDLPSVLTSRSRDTRAVEPGAALP